MCVCRVGFCVRAGVCVFVCVSVCACLGADMGTCGHVWVRVVLFVCAPARDVCACVLVHECMCVCTFCVRPVCVETRVCAPVAWQVWAGLNIFIWTYAMVILMVNWCKLSSSGASLLQIFLDVDWVPSLNTGEDKYNIIVEFTQESLRTDAMFAETARARMLGLFSSLRSTKLSFNIYGRKWRSEFKLWPQAAIIANFLLTWAFTFFLGVAILRRYAHLHFDY